MTTTLDGCCENEGKVGDYCNHSCHAPSPSEGSEQAIYELVGEASMAWHERPTGVFDSERAKSVATRLIALLTHVKEEARAAERADILAALPQPMNIHDKVPENTEADRLYNLMNENMYIGYNSCLEEVRAILSRPHSDVSVKQKEQ